MQKFQVLSHPPQKKNCIIRITRLHSGFRDCSFFCLSEKNQNYPSAMKPIPIKLRRNTLTVSFSNRVPTYKYFTQKWQIILVLYILNGAFQKARLFSYVPAKKIKILNKPKKDMHKGQKQTNANIIKNRGLNPRSLYCISKGCLQTDLSLNNMPLK